jgi:hypothetical protein
LHIDKSIIFNQPDQFLFFDSCGILKKKAMEIWGIHIIAWVWLCVLVVLGIAALLTKKD